MSAGTSEFFCLICLLVCSCTAQKIITAELGQDVILPCKVPNINNINDITAVAWKKSELDSEYVLLYRNKRFDPDNQHTFYKNRVDLQDKEMKDGDVSLILNNVTTEDTGTYMCRVSLKGKTEPISTIFLKVYLSAQKIITAELGQDVILPCKVPNININNINNIRVVEWIRPDQDPEYVLVYRNERFDHQSQHPSYQNRVDLQDKEMKDENVSLILKNVKMEDTGTYECFASQERKTKLISIINLEVRPPDHSWKIIVGVVVPLVVIILSAVGFAYKELQIRKRKKEMQEVIELLKENNSEIIYQLQQVKQKNEALKNELEELMRGHSETSIQFQQQTQRNENLNSQPMELDEMNSDPTGSDEENQQEELKKLQDENQKSKETVGNLKTDHQDMNQKEEPLTAEGP